MPNSQELTREREVLEDMLRSEGWAVFQKRVTEEWSGPGYFSRMGTALQSPDPLAPQIVHRTALELTRMLTWPADRVRHLKGRTE